MLSEVQVHTVNAVHNANEALFMIHGIFVF